MIDNEAFYNFADCERSPATFDNGIEGMEESLLLPPSAAAPPVIQATFDNGIEGMEEESLRSLTNEELNVLMEMEMFEEFEPIPVQVPQPPVNERPLMMAQEDKQSSFTIPKGVYPLQEKISPFTNFTTVMDFPILYNPVKPTAAPVEEGSSSEDESVGKKNNYCPKFRGYQCSQWQERYAELCKFYEDHGHSSVPHTDSPYKRLARWVKRQRYQYKLRQEGKPSAMTDDRIKLLENLQFVWDSHGAAWEDRLKELEEYKAIHGHCNVPSNYKANSSLASWIKCQRRQYRLYREGKNSNITQARINTLESMGFQFNPRVGFHHQRLLGSKGWS